MYGVTDGKRVGTYLEHKFQRLLGDRYTYEVGSSAKGIDFPGLNVDMKVTSVQAATVFLPFQIRKAESARNRILATRLCLSEVGQRPGANRKARYSLHTIYVDESRTADYQTTRGIREILERDGNSEDLSRLHERPQPAHRRIQKPSLSRTSLFSNPPRQGYLTISNALQWRLQYARAIDKAGTVRGLEENSLNVLRQDQEENGIRRLSNAARAGAPCVRSSSRVWAVPRLYRRTHLR